MQHPRWWARHPSWRGCRDRGLFRHRHSKKTALATTCSQPRTGSQGDTAGPRESWPRAPSDPGSSTHQERSGSGSRHPHPDPGCCSLRGTGTLWEKLREGSSQAERGGRKSPGHRHTKELWDHQDRARVQSGERRGQGPDCTAPGMQHTDFGFILCGASSYGKT